MKKDNPEAIRRNAYFAGLFDGEGSVVAHHYFDKRKRKNGSIHSGEKFQFTIEVRMCHEATVRWVARNFGGNVFEKVPTATSTWVQHQFHWRAYNDDAIRILKLIYPYLVAKKRVSALAFKFREVCKQGAWSRNSHRVERQRRLVQQISDLNNFRTTSKAVETAHEAGEPIPEMIQSDLHGDMQQDSPAMAN